MMLRQADHTHTHKNTHREQPPLLLLYGSKRRTDLTHVAGFLERREEKYVIKHHLSLSASLVYILTLNLKTLHESYGITDQKAHIRV